MKRHFEEQLDEMVLADIQARPYTGCFTVENLKHYPTHLYKYRDCNKPHNFAMIEEGYLWADIPANFYDPFDSLVNHKLRSELPSIQKWLYQRLGEILYYCIPPKGMQAHKKGQTLQAYIDAQNKFTDSTGRYNAKKARKVMIVETKKMHPINQREIQRVYDKFESPEFEQKMQDSIRDIFMKVVNTLRERILVCCLTQRKDNQKMWEEYADKYAGFVIEYDLSKATLHADSANILSRTFPVAYYKRLPKVPMLPFIERAFNRDLYGKETDVFDAAKKLYKQLLIKKEEYRSEEEWRILAGAQRIEFPVISAVYMGYKIKAEHAQKLMAICEQGDIPLYKQEFNPFTGSMNFSLVQGGETPMCCREERGEKK